MEQGEKLISKITKELEESSNDALHILLKSFIKRHALLLDVDSTDIYVRVDEQSLGIDIYLDVDDSYLEFKKTV
jgi:hypothetical protein